MTAIAPEHRADFTARVRSAAAVLLITACAALVYGLGVLHPIDDALSQWRFRLLERPPSATLTVVEIDAESLRAAGGWPWGRDRFARVIDNLNGAGAKVVGLDVDFSAPSTTIADDALAASIRRWPGQVVLPTFDQQVGRGADRRQISTRPIEALAKEAVLASVNVPMDSDGRVRRYRHGFDTAAGVRPSMAATLLGRPPSVSDFLIDYGVDAAAIDRISFQDAYSGKFDPALVRDRHVLIGSTAVELGDQFATPKRGVLQGVYIHALAYESLRAGRALQSLGVPFLIACSALVALFLRPRTASGYAGSLRRHLLVGTASVGLPVALQAWMPISLDAGPVFVAQGLSLIWLVRNELQRRAQAVVQAREAHLVQLADHMRESRDNISVAHDKLAVANVALDRALKARTDFLAMTSHEIRTPLNGVMGMTQVILADQTLPDGLREKVRLVHASGETMAALVDDLLDVAKMESGTISIVKAPMDFRRLFDETLAVWSDKAQVKGLSLTGDRAAAPALIEEDAGRLRQILFNLLANAIKFTEAGEVSLSASVDNGPLGDQLVLTIADTGIGIAPDELERIFEPFTQVDDSRTRKYEGTGLGLAISRRLAVAMGGELSVDSQLGVGSRFAIKLPLRAAVATSETTAQPASLAAASVLLVESNPLARGVLRAALSDQVAALEIVESTAQAREAIALRGCDLLLVEGKALSVFERSAIEVLDEFAGTVRGAKIVVLWGGEAAEGLRLQEAGADLVVQKPIAASGLVERLKTVFTFHDLDEASPAHPRRNAQQPATRLKVGAL
ncbi:CHASE2 domain-containing protein [Caulobacter sp. DWR1-3-2b1]|uniref:CHASE2 domain-containing protein n=1 Tax=Caulobacter sp. DWR1-3-2b1 TaxID=2804670 RepID=UPI003CE89413